MTHQPIRLNDKQVAVLNWVKAGMPAGVYEGGHEHRIVARALESRGLITIRGRGKTWGAAATDRGWMWPATPDPAEDDTAMDGEQRSPVVTGDVRVPKGDAASRAMRQTRKAKRGNLRVRQVERRETYMRYKVMVTRVQFAERWVRATDEENAAKKVQEEFDRPYGYFGSWKTLNSEVEVVEAEQTTVITPNPLLNNGPMLLSLKDAARALGISYSSLYELSNRGDIEHTQIGSRKYVSRESLLSFINENTHRGYHASGLSI